MKRLSLEQMLETVKHRLTLKFWDYSFEPHDWFFPSDLSPHNAQFKRYCIKLHKAGLLERQDNAGRWGYRYRVPF